MLEICSVVVDCFFFHFQKISDQSPEKKSVPCCSVDGCNESIHVDEPEAALVESELSENLVNCTVSMLTDLTIDELNKKDDRFNEIQKMLSDLTFAKESFNGDDAKTVYYTGLPSYKVLYWIETRIHPFLYMKNCRISPFQQIVLTLMKLRLNCDMHDLSDRYELF